MSVLRWLAAPLAVLAGLGTGGRNEPVAATASQPAAIPAPRVPPGPLPARWRVPRADDGPRAVPGRLIVRFRPGRSASGLAAVRAALGPVTTRSLPQIGATVISGDPSRSVDALCAELKRRGDVVYAEPDYVCRILVSAPNDPAYNQLDTNIVDEPSDATWYQWSMHQIYALDGWSQYPNLYYTAATKPQNAPLLAVIDSGIDRTHPDFANAGSTDTRHTAGGQIDWSLSRNLITGVDDPADFRDDHGHGTHVAGIAAAATNNGAMLGSGIVGVGYHARLMVLRVIDASGGGADSDVIRAMLYAVDQGAVVVNVSLGTTSYSQAMQDAVDYGWERGTLFVAAMGNEAVERAVYPAGLDKVLGVVATDHNDLPTTYTNYGDAAGIAAPGGDIDFVALTFRYVWSTLPTYPVAITEQGFREDYDYAAGTSMASPHVAGLASLFAASRGITQGTAGGPLRIFRAVQRAAENVGGLTNGGWHPYWGYGRIDAGATLAEVEARGATVGSITGQVRYAGTALQNAQVTATRVGGGSSSATTRSDGMYRIPNVLPGTYTVTATAFGKSQTLNNVAVVVGADTPGATFNISDSSDTTPPSTTAAPSPATPNGTNGWYIVAPTITLAATDNVAVEQIRYRWNSEAEQTYTGPITAPEGAHTLRYRAVDSSGNWESERSLAFKVDLTRPTLPASPRWEPSGATASTTITARWNATTDTPSGMYGYEVRVKQDSADFTSGPYVFSGFTADLFKTLAAANGIAAGHTYHFIVRARDKASVRSAWTAPVPVTVGVGALTGRVTRSGGAVNGALVTITRHGSSVIAARLWTDPDGNFIAGGLAPGLYDATASAPGLIARKLTSGGAGYSVSANANTGPVAIALLAAYGSFTGAVTDGATGAGIGGATVSVVRHGASTALRTTSTGSTGAFALWSLAAGTYDLVVQATGYGTRRLDNGGAGYALGQGVNLVVNPALTGTAQTATTGSISGRVRRSDGITPLPGARVDAYQGSTLRRTVCTAVNGEFVLGLLPPGGSYKVRVSATGVATQWVGGTGYTVTAGADVGPLGITTAETGAVIGLVRRSGVGVSGAMVESLASGAGALKTTNYADATGRYILGGLPPASYSVRATPYVVAPATRGPFTVPSGLSVQQDFAF